MSALPVIVSLGGINPAGRSSCHHGYRRLVFDSLDTATRQHTLNALAALMGREPVPDLLDHTLIRRLETNHFDPEAVPLNVGATALAPVALEMRVMDLPEPLPTGWKVSRLSAQRCRVDIAAGGSLMVPAVRKSLVQAAGQLPAGFDPGALYPSRNHPRALQMAVAGASDALGMLGLDWERVRNSVAPHEVAVYASNLMSQLDDAGIGGMMKFPHQGRRITSKQCPLGLAEMTADFINAYVLGLAGATGGMMGACATFLYNLKLGVQDIRSGRRRIVLVGTSEAPLVPEVMEGYRTMGALAEDDALLALDAGRSEPDYRRACRPFADNAGFTMAESAQFVFLMDDALALELGADILGAVPDVYVHADGIKRSISSPGMGNYLTFGRAVALVRQLLGERGLHEHSFLHAHGTGTPQNRVTESDVFHRVAEAFGVRQWPVAAIKCYLGHSLGSAGGDQLAAALGTFATGWLPGISTLDRVAPDVRAERLSFSRGHRRLEQPSAALLNAKGFGGNNATAVVLSPAVATAMARDRLGQRALDAWRERVQQTRDKVRDYDARAIAGEVLPIYRFGERVLAGEDLEITHQHIRIPGWDNGVPLCDDPDFVSHKPLFNEA